jgi:hypothetical protein
MTIAIIIAAVLISSMLYEISAAIRELARVMRDNNFDGPGEPVEVHTRLTLDDQATAAIKDAAHAIEYRPGGGFRAR